jgi:hypothetical protein
MTDAKVTEISYFYIISYLFLIRFGVQGGSNMTGTNCDLFTHKSSRSYLNHLVECTGSSNRPQAMTDVIQGDSTRKEIGREFPPMENISA